MIRLPRFGRVNHGQVDAFNDKTGQPAVPRLPLTGQIPDITKPTRMNPNQTSLLISQRGSRPLFSNSQA
jgi:hypothetical protein